MSARPLPPITAMQFAALPSRPFARLVEAARREEGVRAVLERFFPPATLRRVVEGGPLETTECEVTALFCDIVGYTAISSQLQPREVMALLKIFLPTMADLVFRFEGTLEKYIGDALLAVWGAPYSSGEDAAQALRCAIAMQDAMAGVNERLRASDIAVEGNLSVHIGLHSGRVAAGNVGTDRYVQYATIGDSTNVASRVCNAAGPGEIVLTEATRLAIGSAGLPFEPMGEVAVKGKAEPLVLWRVPLVG
jgi:adenylate cyclase